MSIGDGVERAIAAVADPMAVMRRVVDEALLLIPAAQGAVVELAAEETLTYACAAGNLAGYVGLRLDAGNSFSGMAIRTRTTLICADSAVDPRVDANACRRVGAVSMICVPLQRGGERVGVLKVSAAHRDAFTQDDVASLAKLAEFISWAIATASDLAQFTSSLHVESKVAGIKSAGEEEIGRGNSSAHARFVGNVLRPGLVADSDTRERIKSVIAGSSIHMVCQPIVELNSGRLVGAEALARFPRPSQRSPDCWFADAHRVGLGTELELAALDRALGLLGDIPGGAYLAVNASARTVLVAEASGLFDMTDPHRVVIELTEHLGVDNYPELSATLIRLRRRGFRIAIDDTGSGFSTFAHILKLAPDIIKLDRILTTGIDLDPVRRALAGALATFADETGAQVVAEGIESPAELDTVMGLDISFGQGYHLGRPAPPTQLTHFAVAESVGG